MTTNNHEELMERLMYFSDKKVTELTDEELQEFMQLRKELQEQYKKLRDLVVSIWEEFKSLAEEYAGGDADE